MIRRSMFIGWYHVLHNPRQYLRNWGRRKSSVEETFILVTPQDKSEADVETGIPQPGNVTERHETTNMFDEDAPEVNAASLSEKTLTEHNEKV